MFRDALAQWVKLGAAPPRWQADSSKFFSLTQDDCVHFRSPLLPTPTRPSPVLEVAGTNAEVPTKHDAAIVILIRHVFAIALELSRWRTLDSSPPPPFALLSSLLG